MSEPIKTIMTHREVLKTSYFKPSIHHVVYTGKKFAKIWLSMCPYWLCQARKLLWLNVQPSSGGFKVTSVEWENLLSTVRRPPKLAISSFSHFLCVAFFLLRIRQWTTILLMAQFSSVSWAERWAKELTFLMTSEGKKFFFQETGSKIIVFFFK